MTLTEIREDGHADGAAIAAWTDDGVLCRVSDNKLLETAVVLGWRAGYDGNSRASALLNEKRRRAYIEGFVKGFREQRDANADADDEA